MPRHTTDRRKSPRAALLREVEIHHHDKVSRGRVVDLNLSGAFIETLEEFHQDEECHLSLTLPGGKTVRPDCVVRYIHSGLGIGIEFQNLTTESRALLTECIAKLK